MSRPRNGGFQIRKRRALLMAEDPHCWYCGKFLVFTETNGSVLPDNFPTIEHLFSRNTGRPAYNFTNAIRRVLACPECNHDRGYWGELLTQAGIQRKSSLVYTTSSERALARCWNNSVWHVISECQIKSGSMVVLA